MEEKCYIEKALQGRGEDPVPMDVAAKSARSMIEKLYQRKENIIGIPTGFHDLDIMTAGIQKGELTVIAGRPCMGKTTLALSILEFAGVTSKIPCALFSLDLSKEKIAQKMISSLGGLNIHKLRTGFFSKQDWSRIDGAIDSMSGAPIYIDETSALTPHELVRKVKKLESEKNIELVVFDYIQCGADVISKEEHFNKITVFSRLLSSLARELNIAVIVLSQLSRAAEEREDHRPRFSDLVEYGDLVNVADNVFLLYREEYYMPTDENKGKTELIIPKHRQGPTGCVNLQFLAEYSKFVNVERCGEDWDE